MVYHHPSSPEKTPLLLLLDPIGKYSSNIITILPLVSLTLPNGPFHWLGSLGNRGNGRYREELRKGLSTISRYLAAYQLDPSRTLLRLDGQYGTGAVLSDLAGFAFVTRGKEYSVLDHPLVQARLHLPPDQSQQRPEGQIVRSL